MSEDVKGAVPGDAGDGDPGSQSPAEESDAPAAEAAPAEVAAAAEPAIDYKDRWLRAEAELQNVRRRGAREREEALARTQDAILLDVIAVLDDLERALVSLSDAAAAEAWAQGVALTAQRLRDTLGRWDVIEIEATGRPFDPSVHEAILEIAPPTGTEPGAVAQVVLKGYRRGARALRPARVVVAKAERGAS